MIVFGNGGRSWPVTIVEGSDWKWSVVISRGVSRDCKGGQKRLWLNFANGDRQCVGSGS